MKIKTIPNNWISKNGYRMDCNPYMGGAVEARATLEALSCKKQPLSKLTKGIINAGRIKRIWADKGHGVPFLSSTDILKADLSNIRYISKRAVTENPKLLIHKGWILITRAGSIGKMSYARSDMDSMACTEDVLRVISDKSKINSGYLYAFLKSKYGLPIVVSGTYGAIIQHIEPPHIADLPVPRLGTEIENEIHDLIEEAAKLRVVAINLLSEASIEVQKSLGWSNSFVANGDLKTNIISSKTLRSEGRMDVLHYSREEEHVSELLDKKRWKYLKDISNVIKPGMFKRIMSTKESGGIAFHTGSELFLMDIKPKYYVSNKTQHIKQCLLEPYWILLQAFGQRGGLIGRVMMTTESLKGTSATDLQIQIKAENKYDAGFIFAYLNSKPGYISIIRTPIGGSIPHIHPLDIENLKVYWPNRDYREKIGKKVINAWDMKDKAQQLEKQAITKLEEDIEKSTTMQH